MNNLARYIDWSLSIPQSWLDWYGSLIVGLCALSLFSLHVLTSPKRKHWISFPYLIRLLVFWTAAWMMVRSVNLTVIAVEPKRPGHMNYESVIVSTLMCALFVNLTIYVLARTFPPRVWSRLTYISDIARCAGRYGKIRAQAVTELAMQGATVVPPGGTVESLIQSVETRRMIREDELVER